MCLLPPLMAACGTTETVVRVPEPVRLAPCPAPEPPELPRVLPGSLDTAPNLLRLRLRDEVLRGYIGGLTSALTCYEEQIAPPIPNPEE